MAEFYRHKAGTGWKCSGSQSLPQQLLLVSGLSLNSVVVEFMSCITRGNRPFVPATGLRDKSNRTHRERESQMSSEHNRLKRILIASADKELVMRFSAALEQNYSLVKWAGNNTAYGILNNGIPDLVLIDPKYFPQSIISTVTEISDANHALRIIIIEDQSDRQIDQHALFKAGAHGFCKGNISDDLLNRAVQMVCEGEYWIQRKLIARMINELARELPVFHKHPSLDESSAIDVLTPRELEVARMVRLGGNNKMIARELDISERTVKAHLSAIFRKLEIQNRLHLALYFNAGN
jgi:two-component system nitrate/nitrite response regulator NarL